MTYNDNINIARNIMNEDLGILDSLEEMIPYSKEHNMQKRNWMGKHFTLNSEKKKRDRYV